jgi:hypothetical protein
MNASLEEPAGCRAFQIVRPAALSGGFLLWKPSMPALSRHPTYLPARPDPAILRLARALARQAAREDHAREMAERSETNPAGANQ